MRGLSLLELTVVVAILAIVAAVALPQLSASDPARVDLATERVVAALRFARAEAMRTGKFHGVVVDRDNSDATGKDLVVYQLNRDGSPFGIDHIVLHPLSRQPYDLTLLDVNISPNFGITNTAPVFSFDGVGSSQHVHFSPAGTPVYVSNGTTYRLFSGYIYLGTGERQKMISLDPVTGRVSVQ